MLTGAGRAPSVPVAKEPIRFAQDSALEGRGFEPPVPLANESSLRRNERCRESEKASLGSVSYLSGHRTFEPGFLRQRG